ncbi:ATP-dependent DNA helicase RecG [Bifidobacterium platyrrhinorum]|uniref:DEAD/DEAH box helicase n=1 Tax=Bifidobacterium platyrrhinorum TaxID=2661628 RepID=A0A6L9SRD0_9BIFI|nr:ATP-dependent DNA helicase RecG [Bifidobacterium platyrrhinorum]NEG55054.1 DEAD/DEAH box helicase [Bifidobacterium platyrrhinorum]
MGITLDTPIAALLANKRRASTLKSFGVVTVGDALTYYPFRVADPVPARAVGEARVGEAMAFAGVVRSSRVIAGQRRNMRLVADVDDSGFAAARGVPAGRAQLVFFSGKKGYLDWMARRLAAGATVVVAGTPTEYMGQLQFSHPQVLTVAPADPAVPVGNAGTAAPAGDPWRDVAMSAGYAAVRPAAQSYDAKTVAEAMARVTRPRPVYHASARLSSERIHETILSLMWALGGRDMAAPGTDDIALQSHDDEERFAGTLAGAVPDILPEPVRAARGLMHRAEAFRAIHEPASVEAFRKGIDTLRYEEALVCQTALLEARCNAHKSAAHPCPLDAGEPGGDAAGEGATRTPLRDRFIASLPFTLTGGQRDVIDDIAADMAKDTPMQRLLQGEVGSGKTVVALAAMLQAVGAGYQAVLVAPTQVLAEQHVETITRMIAAMDEAAPAGASSGAAEPSVPVTLLTGGMRLAARRRALAAAAAGTPGIIVATHAAFSKTFQAPRLALVVIDEQHRFGVEQRESLNTKAADGTAPHLLVMTATPIPRTAAMTWFGDLDISWLTELPGGRKPIRTVVVNEADGRTMGRMFAHIRARIDAGERAYIVCARIDADEDDGAAGHGSRGGRAGESMRDGIDDAYETLDENGEAVARPPLHSVAEIAARLKALPQFAGIRFATLTGRDKDDVKTQVMAGFASGETPILVSTTVIEVGVDVKQASCIVIFDADRYGLSQLHQLRGRVGRGGTNSWAFLVSRAEPGTPGEARLEVIHDSLDGAEIAQADLEFRGAGDVLGDAQSGAKSSLKLLRVVKDAELIADARSQAERLLAADPELAHEPQLAGAVLDFTRGNETFLTSN